MNTENEVLHQPVMPKEALKALAVSQNKWYIDATFGRGGHTSRILQAGGNVIALDHDENTIAFGKKAFHEEIDAGKLILVRENFDQLNSVISDLKKKHSISKISGILFDFGTSVDQLLSDDRGFSFDKESELDMRMDKRLGVTAKDLVAALSVRELTALFREFGGENNARRIAKEIVRTRAETPISTTTELARLVSKLKPKRSGRLHPATKVFQALRIAVNSELDSISTALPQALEVLDEGAIVTISFHEGEDRLAKRFFKEEKATELDEERIKPSEAEITANPRARSAIMRVATKK